jgi:hypothetical protein
VSGERSIVWRSDSGLRESASNVVAMFSKSCA